MGDYKFDTFYYSVDASNEHYLSEIENLSDTEYEQLYKGKMYCPKCKNPQLTLVKRADSSFLRTYPHQLHKIIDGKMCPYSFETASKATMEGYVKELRDKKKIKSTLDAIMRCLTEPPLPKASINKFTEGSSKDALLIEKKVKNKPLKRNVIPHYSFMSWGKNIPQDQLLVVYGKVYVEPKDSPYKDSNGNTQSQTYLQFRNIKTKKFITSCIKPSQLNCTAGEYYTVVLGRCNAKNSNGHTYYNLWINYPFDVSILLKPLAP